MKRAKAGDRLTGGTGDVNPQFYKTYMPIPNVTTVAATGNNSSAFQQFPIPVQRLQQNNGRAMVMEILKIRWINVIAFALGSGLAQGVLYTMEALLATKAPTVPVGIGVLAGPYQNSDPAIIDSKNVSSAVGTTATAFTTFSIDNETPNWSDLTDGAGHGILVATDNVFLAGLLTIFPQDATTTHSASGYIECDILYRWKEVSLAEYIGIVQSQQ